VQSIAFVHAAATLLLTGIAWVVQIVVYPAFPLVPEQNWDRYHRAHSRGMTQVIALPWLAQVVSLVLLLLGGGIAVGRLIAVDAILVALPVAVTVLAVRVHAGLDPSGHPAQVRRLLRLNLARTLAWSTGSVVALVVAASHSG
jgi:hypothetical protein